MAHSVSHSNVGLEYSGTCIESSGIGGAHLILLAATASKETQETLPPHCKCETVIILVFSRVSLPAVPQWLF